LIPFNTTRGVFWSNPFQSYNGLFGFDGSRPVAFLPRLDKGNSSNSNSSSNSSSSVVGGVGGGDDDTAGRFEAVDDDTVDRPDRPCRLCDSGDIGGRLCSLCGFCTGYKQGSPQAAGALCKPCFEPNICLANCDGGLATPKAGGSSNQPLQPAPPPLISERACIREDGTGFCQQCSHAINNDPPNSNPTAATVLTQQSLQQHDLGAVLLGGEGQGTVPVVTVTTAAAADAPVGSGSSSGSGSSTATPTGVAEAEADADANATAAAPAALAVASLQAQAGRVVFAMKRGLLIYNKTQQRAAGAKVCIGPDGGVEIAVSVSAGHPNSTSNYTT
jgi:hypothetical protein